MTREAAGMTLHLARVLNAPPPVVFRAFTEPNELARWWGPKGFTTPSIETDVRAGGSYQILMQPPEGDPFSLSGEFREVVPPSRLAYTFRWDPPDADDVETLVVVVLNDLGRRTGLEVTHGVFATDARRALHEAGWTEALERLQELMPAEPVGGE